MWQIYGLMALDLMNERRREAEAERRAQRARRHGPESRVAARGTIRQALLRSHRA